MISPTNRATTTALVLFLAAAGAALHVAIAQQPAGVTRTPLQREKLAQPGREVVQVRVDLAPGVRFGRHTHPGEEVIYVLEGTFEYEIDGRPNVTVSAGEALFIPDGVPHAARNAGSGHAAELATYLVESGKPLLVLAE